MEKFLFPNIYFRPTDGSGKEPVGKKQQRKRGEKPEKQQLIHTISINLRQIPNLHQIQYSTKQFGSKYIFDFFQYQFIGSLPH